MADDVERLIRDLEALAVRMRRVEDIASPNQLRIAEEFRSLKEQVATIDRDGSHATQRELTHMRSDLAGVRTEVAGWEEDKKALRTQIRSAILMGLAAVMGSIILSAIAWAASHAVATGTP